MFSHTDRKLTSTVGIIKIDFITDKEVLSVCQALLSAHLAHSRVRTVAMDEQLEHCGPRQVPRRGTGLAVLYFRSYTQSGS